MEESVRAQGFMSLQPPDLSKYVVVESSDSTSLRSRKIFPELFFQGELGTFLVNQQIALSA